MAHQLSLTCNSPFNYLFIVNAKISRRCYQGENNSSEKYITRWNSLEDCASQVGVCRLWGSNVAAATYLLDVRNDIVVQPFTSQSFFFILKFNTCLFLKIHHITKYEYDNPVTESVNEVRIYPYQSGDQGILQHSISITDQPEIQQFTDYWATQ